MGSAVKSTQGSTYNAVFNPNLVSRQLELETLLSTFFHPMTMELAKGDKANAGIVLNKTEFVEEGRDSMVIPFLQVLEGEGQIGDNTLLGHEATQKDLYYQVKINQKRHGVKSAGKASRQRVKQLKIFMRAKEQLRQWWALEMDYQKFCAMAEGVSRHIRATVANGGLGWNSGVVKSHPNLFVAGEDDGTYADNGLVTWSDTATTYETNAANAIVNQKNAGVATKNKFSLRQLDRLIPWMDYLKIKPLHVDGKDIYVVALHPRQFQQIAETDGNYRNLLTEVGSRDMKNPIWTGGIGMYQGKFLIKQTNSILGVSSTGSAITYGTTTPHTALDNYDQRVACIFGAGSLLEGKAEPLAFEEEITDYRNFQGVAAGMCWGDARADLSDDGNPAATGRLKKNISSVELVTYSPLGNVTGEADGV